MKITDADIPAPFDRKAAKRAWNKSDAGKASRKKYRHDNSKHQTDAQYLGRAFVGVDGEGVNVRTGPRRGEHDYVELAVSGKSPIVDSTGLSTQKILDYLWDSLNPGDINVIYGGSYDFNCWVKDLVEDEVRALYRSNYTSKGVEYGGYTLRWIKGKSFEISRDDQTLVINDVISFFQRPFIQACDEYLGEYKGRDILVEMKARRGDFTVAEMESVIDYNDLELELLVKLMDELRVRLNRVGLRPRRWNSPGAIASALFLREKVKAHRNEHVPTPVAEAARYAYAGGRFEMLKYGAVKENVYEYDINSAYPRALLDVPSLANGQWWHERADHDAKRVGIVRPYALYRVRYTGTNANIPGPVFVRGANGTISYPLTATNWIWTPEYETLIEYCKQVEGASYEVLESWSFVSATDHKPFAFIQALYDKRKALKAAGDGAHVAIKLALNSIYGKLAQQVGWMPATSKHPLRVPTYHQLEWAGYVTSWCRANVLRAALTNIDAVIAFETDALFTSAPLDILTGEGLGEWEETQFTSLTYVQSGHYYGTTLDKRGNPSEVVKCRGIDKGFISRRAVERKLRLPESDRVLDAKLTRFYGAGIALARGLTKYWRKWLTEPKRMQLRPTGKRVHGNCWCDTDALTLGKWHLTVCPVAGGESHEYPVEWINPNPAMSELAEMRESESTYDD